MFLFYKILWGNVRSFSVCGELWRATHGVWAGKAKFVAGRGFSCQKQWSQGRAGIGAPQHKGPVQKILEEQKSEAWARSGQVKWKCATDRAVKHGAIYRRRKQNAAAYAVYRKWRTGETNQCHNPQTSTTPSRDRSEGRPSLPVNFKTL